MAGFSDASVDPSAFGPLAFGMGEYIPVYSGVISTRFNITFGQEDRNVSFDTDERNISLNAQDREILL